MCQHDHVREKLLKERLSLARLRLFLTMYTTYFAHWRGVNVVARTKYLHPSPSA